MKSSLTFIERFKMISGQLGGIFGAGIASGATIVAYFHARGGYISYITYFLALILIFYLYYLGLEIGRVHGLTDYKSVYDLIFGKHKKFFTLVTDASMLVSLFAGLCFAFSGVASLLNPILGINPFVCALAIGIVCLLINAFGYEAFNKFAGIMGFFICVVCIICYSISLFNGGFAGLVSNISSKWMPEGASIVKGIWYAILYASINVYLLSVLLLSTQGKLKSSSDVKSTLGVGFVTNLFAIYLPAICILAFSPEVLEAPIIALGVFDAAIPGKFAQTVYSVLLVIAFISTGAPVLMAMGQRFERYLPGKIKNPNHRNIITQILFSLIGLLSAQFGINQVAMVSSIFLAPLAMVGVFLPLLIRGPIILRQKKNEDKKLAAVQGM